MSDSGLYLLTTTRTLATMGSESGCPLGGTKRWENRRSLGQVPGSRTSYAREAILGGLGEE